MTNTHRVHVYLRQRYGSNFPRSYAQDAFSSGARLTTRQRRRAAKRAFRAEESA
jgi:hypothetical protein